MTVQSEYGPEQPCYVPHTWETLQGTASNISLSRVAALEQRLLNKTDLCAISPHHARAHFVKPWLRSWELWFRVASICTLALVWCQDEETIVEIEIDLNCLVLDDCPAALLIA